MKDVKETWIMRKTYSVLLIAAVLLLLPKGPKM